MKLVFFVIGMVFQVGSASVFAAEANREVQIVEILSLTGNRPNSPALRDMTRVYVNPASWGSTNCREDAADLRKVDTHTYSMLLTAWASGKTVIIGVDDSLKPYDGVCQLVWIKVK